MIFVDGEKYACAQCIRGHRSSSCKHTTRPLLLCRSRGRPALNAGHRIAVTETIKSEHGPSLPSPSPTSTPTTSTTSAASSSTSSSSSSSTDVSHSLTLPLSTTPVSIIKQESTTPTEKSCCGGVSKPKAQITEHVVPKASCCSGKKPAVIPPTEPTPKACCSKPNDKESPKQKKRKNCQCNSDTCKCSSGNPILLKAAKRSFVDFKGGNLRYVGPYQEKSLNNFKVGMTGTIPKRAQHNPGPCCPPLKKPQPLTHGQLQLSELTVFKTLVLNEVHKDQEKPFIPIQPKQEANTQQTLNDRKMEILSYPHHQLNGSHSSFQDLQQLSISDSTASPHPHLTPMAYDMLLSNGCTVECNCGPTCCCETCLVHRTNEELRKVGLIYQSVSTPSDTHASENGETRDYTPEPTPDLGNSINFTVTDELFMDECQCPDDSCECENCIKHNIIGGIKFPQGAHIHTATDGHSDAIHDLGLAEFDLPQSLMYAGHDCGCEPEDCQCLNCSKHGIVNGVRVGPGF